ncbi:MAG: hypothetical protein ACYTAF_06610, partial [Planctomycetota bacterium]
MARLRRREVITDEQALLLTRLIEQKEAPLSRKFFEADEACARHLYRLLVESVRSSPDEPPLLTTGKALQTYYSSRFPAIVQAMGLIVEPEVKEPAPPAPEPEAPPVERKPPKPMEVETVLPEPAPDAAEEAAPVWSLARFLETFNIHWGMLAGGLLIIGCSLALVVSLWQSDSPMVRYLTFLAVTLGLNGFGHLACRKLKLTITGRTFLAVSLMLMPLNLMVADFFGAAVGQAIPLYVRLTILAVFSVIIWLSLTVIDRDHAMIPTAVFTGLIGLQLLVEPLSASLAGGSMLLPWGGAVLYTAGLSACLFRMRGRTLDGPQVNQFLFVAGLLGFAHLLLPARVYIEVLQGSHISWILPVLALHLLAGLMFTRVLRSRAAPETHGRKTARVVDTVIHFILPPTIVLTAGSAEHFLATALLALAAYVAVAAWHRSRTALGVACVLTAVAYYTAMALLYELDAGRFRWFPDSPAELAFRMLPLVPLFYLAGEIFVRWTRRDAKPAEWAGTPVLWAARATTTTLFLAMLGSSERYGDSVALLGGLGVLFGLLFRRREYLYAAVASLPLVLLLAPRWLPEIPGVHLAMYLSVIGIAYLGSGLWLRRSGNPLLESLSSALLQVPLLMVPIITWCTFSPEITHLSVFSAAACMVICAAAAFAYRWQILPAVAGLFYTMAAALALHRWVCPLDAPMPVLTPWALAAAVPLLLGGIALRRRDGGLGQFFGTHALGWGFFVLGMQVLLYVTTPVETVTSICAGLAALILLAPTVHLRAPAGTYVAAAFVLICAFFAYHCIDPVGGRLPRWIPLAPLAASALLFGAAVILQGPPAGWRRAVFRKPLWIASAAAAAIVVALTAYDMDPRKVWVLSLALLPLVTGYFRLGKVSFFMEVFVVLVTGVRFTALLLGTSGVAALTLLIEKGLTYLRTRPAGAWMESVSPGALSACSLAMGVGMLGVLILVSMSRVLPDRIEVWWWPSAPGLLYAGPAILIACWTWTLFDSRRPRFVLPIGLAGAVALLWTAAILDHETAWRWLAFSLAAYSAVWTVPGRIVRAPGWLKDRLQEAAEPAAHHAATIGLASALLAVLVALIHPDHPASIATGYLLTALGFCLAAKPATRVLLRWA